MSGQSPTRLTPPADSLFVFHSNFWLNLHHFLYVTARARSGLDGGRVTVTDALTDTAGFGALSGSDRGAWQAAVAYYDTTLARRDILFDSVLVRINNQLAKSDSRTTLDGSGIDPSLAEFLERAAPVYRHLWWPHHDAANRAWEATMQRLLAVYGEGIAQQESRVFHEPWSRVPVRVDVSAYANWAGAYTTNNPSHITVSSRDAAMQNSEGLETLFHEVLHTMDDTLYAALESAFREQRKTLPRDPTHVFIFYTAGELTQRAIPGHIPYAEKNGLWSRSPDFARVLPSLQRDWQPYLDGKITFYEAVRRYAGEM